MSSSTAINSTIRKRVEEWRRRLIDLSKRNQLMSYKKNKSSTLEIVSPTVDEIYQHLAVNNNVFNFYYPAKINENEDEADGQEFDADDVEMSEPKENELVSTEQDPQSVDKILKNLYRKSKEEYQERGVHVLHVGLGMLTWTEPSSNQQETHLSPILLCTVSLVRESAKDPYELHFAEEDLLINPALQVKLKKDFNIELPMTPEDVDETGVSSYLDSVRQLISPIGWQVDDSSVLALFSFEKLGMYHDLEKNIALIAAHPCIRALSGDAGALTSSSDIDEPSQLDNKVKPQDTFQILDADSSQQQAIQAVLNGCNLVLQGPPGTGKSQTIANIIAEFIARNKTVLFVSEKMAALEVVYNRLADKKLDNFCLPLHSRNANKKEVLQKLYHALEHELRPPTLPNEQDYQKAYSLRQRLNDYVIALHEKKPLLGYSIRQAIAQVSKNMNYPMVPLRASESLLSNEKYEGWYQGIRRLSNVWDVAADPGGFPWRGCKETSFAPGTEEKWLKLLQRIQESLQELYTTLAVYQEETKLPPAMNLKEVIWIVEVAKHLELGTVPDAKWLTTNEIDDILLEAQKYDDLTKQFWELRSELESRGKADFFELQDDMGEQLAACWAKTNKTFPKLDSEGVKLLSCYASLYAFVKFIPEFISEIMQDVQQVEQAMGYKLESYTIDSIKKLSIFASLCHEENRPETEWLTPKGLRETQAFVTEIKPIFDEYNQKRQELLVRYEESIFSLDVGSYIEKFNSLLYTSPLKFVNPGYYQAKSSISQHTKEFQLPHSIQADLLTIRTVQSLQVKIDAVSSEARQLLVSYFSGAGTNFDAVLKALEVAGKAICTNEGQVLPLSVQNIISLDGNLPKQYKGNVAKLVQRMHEWQDYFTNLKEAVSFDGLIGTGVDASYLPLTELQQWVCSVEPIVSELASVLSRLMPKFQIAPASMLEIVDDIETLMQTRKISQNIETESAFLQERFGRRFVGLKTSWQDVLASLQWTIKFRSLLRGKDISAELIEYLVNPNRTSILSAQQIEQLYDKFTSLYCGQLKLQFEDFYPAKEGKPIEDLPLSEFSESLNTMTERVSGIDSWVSYKNVRAKLVEEGLRDFIGELEVSPPKREEIVGTFERAYYQAQVNEAFTSDPRLADFRGQNHEQLIEEFRTIDKKLLNLAPLAVVQKCNEVRPKNGLSLSGTEVSILKTEAAKSRRHMPLMKIFQKIPNLLLRLKPCLMMSPLSVSQYIQPDCYNFDLVIFDEASQIFTEDAVVAIYRGKQVVIAGDSKQMPPTNFFKSAEALDDEYNDEDDGETVASSADFASVLDECGPIFPQAMLKWHYRSRHESLITFSNHQFYNGHLVTFPSSDNQTKDLGVQFAFVENGVYERGGKKTNSIEAQAVADLVIDHFRRFPDRSLGVVAFSQSQMVAIDDVLEERRHRHPELEPRFKENRLDGFFVKNLENVQGDERDVIIFSVGYGKDQHGRLSMNFGPLNKDGGERRLNVAITRAREKVVLVSSIRASDMDISGTKAAGVLNLYKYLRYAEVGENALEITNPEGLGDTESPFEDDVAGVIRQLGYDVVTQVGCSGYRVDIGVIHPSSPGKFILGVECDGATYHSAHTARDRDRLRQQVLENLGWRIYRIWSPDWFYRRNAEIDRLKKALEVATEVPPKRIKNKDEFFLNELTEVVVSEEEPTDLIMLPGVEPYVLCILPFCKLGSHEFHDPACREWHIEKLSFLVSNEGPIHLDIAAKRLAEAWGLARVGQRMKTVIENAARTMHRRDQVRILNSFLWPIHEIEVKVRVPQEGKPETMRDIKFIPDEEIQSAMMLIIGQSIGISHDNLLQETARVFGFRKNGAQIQPRLEQCYQKLEKENKIVKTGETITLPR